jgi:lipoyl(octanoyl) transferase
MVEIRVAARGPPPYSQGVVFESIRLWIDPVARPGPEAMAVDEWLLETATVPVLRVYRWQGEWGSVGYFGDLAQARETLPGLSWVRRWTGGGTVDHRSDWTYTVVAPAGSDLARMKAAESYRILHEALATVLAGEGLQVALASDDVETGDSLCFRNPVGHDLVDASGMKIAGAGQRRTRVGMLHQGSVALRVDLTDSALRAECFASRLAESIEFVGFIPPDDQIAERIARRYGHPDWTEARRAVRANTVTETRLSAGTPMA